MKRNMDLIREILKKVEQHDDPNGLFEPLEVDGYTKNQISYHIKLLNDREVKLDGLPSEH